MAVMVNFGKVNIPNAALSFYDIKDLISACGVVKQPGQPDKDDQYASSLSVMGSISSSLSGGYSTPEVNRLDPTAAPIKTVGKHPGTYTLSVENGLRGIAIKLPPEHPLRQADKSLRNVTFTIPGGSPVLAGNPRSPSINPLFRINTVDVIATGKAMSYDIDSMGYDTFLGQQKRIGQEPSDMLRTAAIVDPQQEPIIYLDKTLGIVVTAGRDKESNQIFVRVNDIDSPKSQFKIKYFKQLAHHQSMLIAQAHE